MGGMRVILRWTRRGILIIEKGDKIRSHDRTFWKDW